MPIFECSRCNELTYSASPDAVRSCERCGSVSHRVVDGDFTAARVSGRVLAAADHASLVYEDPARIAPFCARFLTQGVDAGERVIAGVEPRVRDAIEPLLAADVGVLVEWDEPARIYGDFDPDRIASMYDALIAAQPGGTRILAGIDAASAGHVTADELDRYERLAHAVITNHGATAVCVYDARALPQEFIEVAARRHSLSIEAGGPRRNERFEYAPA